MGTVIDATLKYWAGAICGLMGSVIAWLWRRLSKTVTQQKAVNGAILALLRDRINESCRYHLEKGSITSRDYEVLMHMFEEYFIMGGNGVVARLKQEIDKLPVIVNEVH